MELYLVVGAPGRAEEAAAIGRALCGAGLGARVAAAGEVPVDAVRLIRADDLCSALAGIAEGERARWLECTVVVNEARERVIDLCEEHGLLGAVECEDVSDWGAGPARLFVRKEVVERRGEWIAGAGARESDEYGLWSDPDAGSLAGSLARYLDHWRESDAELVISAEEAQRRKLPPVELRLRPGGTGLVRIPPAHSTGYYVVLGSAPGGAAAFLARPAPPDERRAEGLEQTARRMLQNPNGPELALAGGIERVRARPDAWSRSSTPTAC